MTQKNANQHKFYLIKNQHIKNFIGIFICVNSRILRHLRSFGTASFFIKFGMKLFYIYSYICFIEDYCSFNGYRQFKVIFS
jgi:hypothetical protein